MSQSIVKIIDIVGFDSWRACREILLKSEETEILSFSENLEKLKTLSPELLKQLLTTDTGQHQLSGFLEH